MKYLAAATIVGWIMFLVWCFASPITLALAIMGVVVFSLIWSAKNDSK